MIDSYTTQITTIIIHMVTQKKTLLKQWLLDTKMMKELRESQ